MAPLSSNAAYRATLVLMTTTTFFFSKNLNGEVYFQANVNKATLTAQLF